MKNLKPFLTGFSLFVAIAAFADNDRPITVNQLPEPARQFIEHHFGNRKVALAKMDSDFMKKSYEVIFTDGSQVEFDSRGVWKEVDCKFSEVPAAIIPTPIAEHVRTHYPERSIVKIEKDCREYEVKLSNKVELTFDSQFGIVDIDY